MTEGEGEHSAIIKQMRNALTVADHNDPFYLHPSDNPGMVLVSKAFDGSGFGTWKRSMLIALSAKNKIGFVNGTLERPKSDDTEYRTWERCNDMVLSWILNSVSKGIAESIIFSDSAKDMWNELCERYGQSNLAQLFSVQKELCVISQGTDTIATYYTRIKRLWDELSSLKDVPVCTCASQLTWSKYEMNQRLIQFLMGLNDSYASVRGNILMMNPVPNIAQVYSMLSQEEKQREFKTPSHFGSDVSAMSVKGQRSEKQSEIDARKASLVCTNCKKTGHLVESCWQVGTVPTKRPPLVCTHCKKTGHVVEFCYKIIGYPKDRDGRDSKEKKMAAQTSGSEKREEVSTLPGFTSEQCAQLLNLLKGGGKTEHRMDFAGCSFAGPFSEEPSGSW